jgi:hypothetical protein
MLPIISAHRGWGGFQSLMDFKPGGRAAYCGRPFWESLNQNLTILAAVSDWEELMAVFRIYLADGDRRVKADLKARDEVFARMSAERWFGDGRWRIVEIQQLSNQQPEFRQLKLAVS